MTHISWSSDFVLYLEDYLMYEHHTLESVWPDVWSKNKCRSLWPIFHGPVILPYILKTVCVWPSYFRIMGQYDTMFDLKISVWVVGSGDGAGYLPVPGHPTTLAYGKAGACCACSRCGTGGLFFVVVFSSRLSNLPFLMPHLFWRRLDILKYCGLRCYNPTVVVSYHLRRAR